jgi:hypothetical protein
MAGAADKKTSIGSGWNARILELFKLSPAQEMQQMGGWRSEVRGQIAEVKTFFCSNVGEP